MSSDNEQSRRDILRKGAEITAGTAALTSLAGCSTSGTDDQTPADNGENTTNQPNDNTSTDPNNNDSDYNPSIRKGDEFNWFIDPRMLDDRGYLHEKTFEYTYENQELRQLAKEILPFEPWQVYRTQEVVEALSQENIDYIDDNTRSITGRGFVDADWSDMGTKVVLGRGMIGAADITYTPDQIKNALEDNFEQIDERNGRTRYRGEFTEDRHDTNHNDIDSWEREVLIGHEKDGNNIIWVADFPERSQVPKIINEIEGPYEILDETVSGDRKSVVEGEGGQMVNESLRIFQNSFDDGHHLFNGYLISPTYEDEDTRDNGDDLGGRCILGTWGSSPEGEEEPYGGLLYDRNELWVSETGEIKSEKDIDNGFESLEDRYQIINVIGGYSI